MIEIVRQAGKICTLNKPLYCPKNGEHFTKFFPLTSTFDFYKMYTFDFYGTKRKKILDKKEKIIKFK